MFMFLCQSVYVFFCFLCSFYYFDEVWKRVTYSLRYSCLPWEYIYANEHISYSVIYLDQSVHQYLMGCLWFDTQIANNHIHTLCTSIGLSPYSTRRAKHDGRRMRCAFERNGRRTSDRFRSREESADF